MLVKLYTAWDKSEPGKGYAAKAAEAQRRADEFNAMTRAAEAAAAAKK